MNLLYHSLAIYLSLTAPAFAASKDSSKPAADKPCTLISPYTGSFFDLTSLRIPMPDPESTKKQRQMSWNATGFDLGYNFTVNICGPVIEPIEDVVGLDRDLWRNVSAYYTWNNKTYALGLNSSEMVMRGRKLVLNYTGGSPCDSFDTGRTADLSDHMNSTEIIGDDDDDNKHDNDNDRPSRTTRRKSVVISMQCERDPLAPLFALSYVATMDQCTYFFEGRSNAACATANTSSTTTLNPASVFGVIALIAIIVYMVGGCVYNRAVLNQRGWQQVPNYNLWAGIFGFFRDLFIIMTSSCARCMPARRGYSRVNGGIGPTGGRGRARGDSSDAENRLIDELNEEWED